MLTLEATQTLRGVAETADIVTVSVFGDESGSESDNDFKVLYQGQLAAATSILYTTPASHATLIKSIHIRNTHPTLSKWVELFVGGVGNENSVARFVVPTSGAAVYDGHWSIYDANGQISLVGAPGADGVDGSTWHEGTGAPSGALGVNGDFYLNDANGDVYEKVTGTWGIVANILGPQGDAGSGGAHSALTGLTTGDDHTQYQKESEKDQNSGYVGLGASQGTRDGTKFLRDDGTWQTVSGGGGGLTDHTHAATGTGANGGGGTLAPTALTLPTGAAQNDEGRITWDSTNDRIIVGQTGGNVTFARIGGAAENPSTQAVGDAAAPGSSIIGARLDHKHAMPAFGSPVAVGTANAAGSSTSLSRAGHTHALQGAAIQTQSATSSTLTAGSGGDVTLTWPTAFADANYKVSLGFALNDSTNRAPPTGYLKINTGDAPTASRIIVRVLNNASVSEAVTVHAIAVHD